MIDRGYSVNIIRNFTTNGVRLLSLMIFSILTHLFLYQKFCKATSVITVHSEECIKIVESGEVGIGQLFRYLDKLPTFSIGDAGRCQKGGLWRSYTLGCSELKCEILEEFVPHAWEIQPLEIDFDAL